MSESDLLFGVVSRPRRLADSHRVHGATLVSPCLHPDSKQVTLFTARDYISGDEFSLRRCDICALVRTNSSVTHEDIHRYYPPEYYGDAIRYVFPIDHVLTRLQFARTRRIQRAHRDRVGRVLDVGCGRGLLLQQLRRLGWEVTGTELSDRAARFARETLQLDVRVGDLRVLNLEDEAFDTVVLWHVLEHVDDPAGLLREVSRLLPPGGLVLVGVPNFGSIEAQVSRADWFHLDVPRHVSHFMPHVLMNMLSAEGFTVECSSYYSPEYDHFSFIQTALNGLGLPQNLLYELLRTGPAKFLRLPGARRHQRFAVASLVLAPFLAILSLLVVPLMALLHRGSTLVVYARKS